jgi:4-hydroxy-tetrahydrodipicolinate synthase
VSLAGVCPVLVTPFGDDQQVISKELRSQVEWVVELGANAVVYPGVVSEFFTLTDRERYDGIRAIVDASDGRVPVVAGVSAPSGPAAAALAKDAHAAGAAAVMATMPYVQHFFSPSRDYAADYYRAIADATPLPIILQNARIGHALAPGAITEIVNLVPTIRYVKEETAPSTHALGAVIAALGEQVDGVFGGLGGVHLAQELARGAIGTMPSPALADFLIRAYQHWREARQEEARLILGRLGGLFALELLYNVALVKEILRQRGIITSTRTRVPAPALDTIDLEEINILLTDIDGLAGSDAASARGDLSRHRVGP